MSSSSGPNLLSCLELEKILPEEWCLGVQEVGDTVVSGLCFLYSYLPVYLDDIYNVIPRLLSG